MSASLRSSQLQSALSCSKLAPESMNNALVVWVGKLNIRHRKKSKSNSNPYAMFSQANNITIDCNWNVLAEKRSSFLNINSTYNFSTLFIMIHVSSQQLNLILDFI